LAIVLIFIPLFSFIFFCHFEVMVFFMILLLFFSASFFSYLIATDD